MEYIVNSLVDVGLCTHLGSSFKASVVRTLLILTNVFTSTDAGLFIGLVALHRLLMYARLRYGLVGPGPKDRHWPHVTEIVSEGQRCSEGEFYHHHSMLPTPASSLPRRESRRTVPSYILRMASRQTSCGPLPFPVSPCLLPRKR
jgi:hypothetical protein